MSAFEVSERRAAPLAMPLPLRHVIVSLGITFGIGCVWLLWSGGLANLAFSIDDAAITLSNARALLSGSDPANPGVSPFHGATSTVHLLLTAAILALTGDVNLTGLLVDLGGIALYLWALLRLVDHLGSNRLCAGMAGIGGLMLVFQFVNGLETTMAAAAVAYVLGSLAKAGRPRFEPMLALVLGVAPFIRPELGILWPAFIAGRWGALRQGDWRATAEVCGAGVLVAALLVGVTLALGGEVLPQTLAAKRYFFPKLDAELQLLVGVGSVFMFGLVGCWLALARSFQRPVARAALLMAIVLPLVYTLANPLLMVTNHGRYLAPFAPVAVVALAFAGGGALYRYGLLAWLLAFPAFSAPAALADLDADRAVWMASAQFLREETPKDAIILAHDIGRISLAGERRLVDLVGLKTPWVVEVMRRFNPDQTIAGQKAGMAAVMRRARPDYILALEREGSVWNRVAEVAHQQAKSLTEVRRFGCKQTVGTYFCMVAWKAEWPPVSN